MNGRGKQNVKNQQKLQLLAGQLQHTCTAAVVRTGPSFNSEMHAMVHAVVAWMSKVKRGGQFYADVSDGCSLMRVVLLNEWKQGVLQQLEGHANKKLQHSVEHIQQKNGNCCHYTTILGESDVKFAMDNINTYFN